MNSTEKKGVQNKKILCYSILKLLCLILILNLSSQETVNAQAITKSTILIADENDQWTRNQWHIDNIAWGFLPWGGLNNSGTMNSYYNQINAIQSEGRKYHARIEFDASWKNFIEYCAANNIQYADHACKGLNGAIYEYPWFAGQRYNNGSPYWISSHSPEFNNFLKFQIDKQMGVELEILMIDAQTSSALASFPWSNGDFSTHCMSAFTAYLSENYTTGELSSMGINNVANFNYKTYLNDLGYNSMGSYDASTPLVDVYRLFQNKAVGELTQEMAAYARSKSQNEILVGASSPLQDTYRSTINDDLDFYQEELHQLNPANEPLLSFKLGETLNKKVVATGDPGDWREVLYGNVSEDQVEEWIAVAYANGANFIAPVRQWAYNSDYYSASAEMRGIYQFIDENGDLLEQYNPLKSKLALIQSRAQAKKNSNTTSQIVRDLVANNIYFDLIIAGDAYYESAPDIGQLNSYEKVVMSRKAYDNHLAYDTEWSNALQSLGNKLVLLGDDSNISELSSIKDGLSNQISVSINNNDSDNMVSAFPRVSDAGTMNIHLINRDYNNSLQHIEKSNIDIQLDGSSFGGSYTSAIFHTPGGSTQNLAITSNGSGLSISGIDNLEYWGILELIQSDSPPVDPTSVALNLNDISLNVGGTQQLAETVLPANATDKTVTWTSSNTAVATVDANGLVSAVSIGSVDITVTTNTGALTDVASVTVSPTSVTDVWLDQTSLSIVINGSSQLIATVLPANASNKNVTWSSSDNAVASVDANGIVSALGIGSATISATTADGGFDAQASVTVIEQPEGVVIELEDFIATGGSSANGDNSMGYLTYTVGGGVDAINWNQTGDWGDYTVDIPANGTYSVVINAGSPSEDPAVEIIVDGNSLLNEAFAASGDWDDFDAIELTTELDLTSGEHTFRIQSSGSSTWQWNGDNITLTLVGGPEIVDVTDVTLNHSSATLEIGGSVQLTATVLPVDATNKSVTWTSSNNAYASVDANGVVTAIDGESATITVTTDEGGFTATSIITINPGGPSVESVSLDQDSLPLKVGESAQLYETILPLNAADKSVTWASSNTSVATVSNGLVTAIAEGNATITVTTVDGDYTATSSATVSIVFIPETGVILDQATLALNVGGSAQLKETVLPANATDKSVTWSSSNESIATVSNTGLVSAISNGNATITVTSNNGGFTANSVVTVSTPIGSTLIIEAEDFSLTGGAHDGFEIYDAGNDITATNWNQTGDWAEYEVDITEAGDYSVTYLMATAINGAAVTLYLNATQVREDNVPSTGGWSTFDEVVAGGTVFLSVGTHAIGLVSSGSNGWEWNMDKFILSSGGNASAKIGGEELQEQVSFNMYPNPTTNFLNLDGLKSGQYQIVIYSATGAEFLNQTRNFDNKGQIDVSSLRAGQYIIQVTGNDVQLNKRFIKQ